MSDKPKDWVQEARWRCNTATSEPWIVADEKMTPVGDLRMEHGGFPKRGYSHWCSLRPEDGRFIAAARTDLPRALDVIEAADALVAATPHTREWRAALANYQEKRK